MIVLGLTGSIGMGKSTTARMFAEAGIPVWDADATVHALYGPLAAGSEALRAIAPEAVTDDGVDRAKLREAIIADATLLKKIEAIIHPLVGQDRGAFLHHAERDGHAIVLCDIPLLFEGGAEQWLDKVVVVTAPADVQRERVMARPSMTEQVFQTILSKQVPDAVKREKADYLIDTSLGMDHARARVAAIIEELCNA